MSAPLPVETNVKPLDSVEFRWDLASLPPQPRVLPEHYAIALAGAEDEEEIRKVIARALTLDPAWSAELQRVIAVVDEWLDGAFQRGGNAIALRHGQRIIGAVIVTAEPTASSNLAPGPCVSMEYRNRGFGSQLLAAALEFLRDRGATHAIGITRASATVARSLYAKFGGVAEAADADSLLAT